MGMQKITQCPYCGAGAEDLTVDSYVDMSFRLKKDKQNNLTIDTDRIWEIAEEDIIEGITDTADNQGVFCTECGTNFKAKIVWDDNGELTVLCDPARKTDIKRK